MLAGRTVVAAVACIACAVMAAGQSPDEAPLTIAEQAVDVDVVEVEVADVHAEDSGVLEPEASVLRESPDENGVTVGEPVDVGESLGPGLGPGTACECCEPAATFAYTTVDALFLQRDNTVGPLAVNDQTGATVIAAGDVRYPTTPGVRIQQGWRGPECNGLEVVYLGVWNMRADGLAVSAAGDLALPGQLGQIGGSGLDAATSIEPTLAGSLNSVEFNIFSTRIHDGCRQHDQLPWRRSWDLFEGSATTVDWMLGIRWAGLDESATLDVTAQTNATPPEFNTTSYRVTSASHLVGPQIGHRRRVEWDAWAFEGWAKIALMGGFLTESQSGIVGPFDRVQVRGPQTDTRQTTGMIGDVNATVVRRFGEHWGLRAGYTLLWLTGVAPAANQWDFTNTPSSGTGVVTGVVFLHGATLGLEATW